MLYFLHSLTLVLFTDILERPFKVLAHVTTINIE